jgi:ribonuclease HII
MKPILDEKALPEYELICGIDEVGRGPIAGPVVASAVVFEKNYYNPSIIDSKKLTTKKIQELSEIIKNDAISFAIGLKDAEFIDKYDILTATFKAMEEAFNSLKIKPSIVYIDGHLKNPYLKGVEQVALVKGETKSVAIAAASIIAKDFRDKLMLEYAMKYPQYAFDKHKGYGTKLHFEMLKKYGPSPIHRKSFLPFKDNVKILL